MGLTTNGSQKACLLTLWKSSLLENPALFLHYKVVTLWNIDMVQADKRLPHMLTWIAELCKGPNWPSIQARSVWKARADNYFHGSLASLFNIWKPSFTKLSQRLQSHWYRPYDHSHMPINPFFIISKLEIETSILHYWDLARMLLSIFKQKEIVKASSFFYFA